MRLNGRIDERSIYMRKKILSLALTLLLCAAMTVPASADWKESIPSY